MELKVLESNAEQSSCPSNGCGSSFKSNPVIPSSIPSSIQERIHNHPCFSEEAHHHYARMHVAVAPACNIQCHYCNRKYDCSNESRPGVVSELLNPKQAVKKVLAVASEIPQMTVVGIAGPGDPMANPERTFATFQALTEQAPDLKLCVSTNGLNMPEHVDELLKHNIDHVTITINCVDPDIGAKIYPWIFWNHRRIKGRKAAKILIQQQQKSLDMLIASGVLVKVNTVVIPGVNDHHIAEVSRVVKAKGVFLHNVMPLIAEAEHGTFYGLMGQRGPTPEELLAIQDECGDGMNMMRHCRQCRADAVGMLGEDRSADFTMDKIEMLEIDYQKAMQRRTAYQQAIEEGRREPARLAEPQVIKQTTLIPISSISTQPKPIKLQMAVASSGQGVINQHFGHAREFMIYEVSESNSRLLGVRRVDQYCIGDSECVETEDRIQQTIEALNGCCAVLCARIGMEPWDRLVEAGIQPNGEHAYESIELALQELYWELAPQSEQQHQLTNQAIA